MTSRDRDASTPVDVVRRHYRAPDAEALRACFAEDVEWTEMAGSSMAGTYRGFDEIVRNVMQVIDRDWVGFAVHDETYIADGEQVVVLGRYTGTHRATGKRLDARVAHHFVVRDGRIARFEQFADTALISDAEA